MNTDGYWYDKPLTDAVRHQLQRELDDLDHEQVLIDGKLFKPSQCFHAEFDPVHILFNTNCPADLREKVEMIFARYLGPTPD